MSKKGQIFIIMSIVIIIILVVIKTSMNLVQVLENKKEIESSIDRLEFDNIRKEAVRAATSAANSTLNISKNSIGFLDFAKRVSQTKSKSMEGVAILSIFPTVLSSTDTRINVTFANFFDRDVDTLNLNFTANALANQTYKFLSPGSIIDTNFTFNINSNRNYTLWVFYNTTKESITENISINVEMNRKKFFGYYDLRMFTERLEQRDRFTEEVVLP